MKITKHQFENLISKIVKAAVAKQSNRVLSENRPTGLYKDFEEDYKKLLGGLGGDPFAIAFKQIKKSLDLKPAPILGTIGKGTFSPKDFTLHVKGRCIDSTGGYYGSYNFTFYPDGKIFWGAGVLDRGVYEGKSYKEKKLSDIWDVKDEEEKNMIILMQHFLDIYNYALALPREVAKEKNLGILFDNTINSLKRVPNINKMRLEKIYRVGIYDIAKIILPKDQFRTYFGDLGKVSIEGRFKYCLDLLEVLKQYYEQNQEEFVDKILVNKIIHRLKVINSLVS